MEASERLACSEYLMRTIHSKRSAGAPMAPVGSRTSCPPERAARTTFESDYLRGDLLISFVKNSSVFSTSPPAYHHIDDAHAYQIAPRCSFVSQPAHCSKTVLRNIVSIGRGFARGTAIETAVFCSKEWIGKRKNPGRESPI